MICIFTGYRTRLFLITLALMLLCFFSAAAENSAFSVKCVGRIVSHSENAFSVQAPDNGTCVITVYDSYHVYRVIRQEVCKGENKIPWDGCSYNLEKLNTGSYSFDCSFVSSDGQTYTYRFKASVANNAQFLQFALPSSDTVYLSDPDEWFLETKTILDGKIRLEFFRNGMDSPGYSVLMTMHKGRVEHFTFSKLAGKSEILPGSYTVRVFETGRPDRMIEFPLNVSDEIPVRESVCVTGDIMPQDLSDDSALWRSMTEPAVVVDKDYTDHQDVYADMDSKSSVLGTLHGQTQCLSVLEICGEWARISAWNHEDASRIEGWVPYGLLKVVYPSCEYGLLLNKKEQTLSVYYHGKKIETLLVSTGRMDKEKYFRETSAGCFVTGLHRVDFSTLGSRYDFVIQYDGGNLLHQIPYFSGGNKDFTYGKANLGSKASHACIRIQDEPGAMEGINAYWIWTHIPYHTKLIILDDQEEREKEKALLAGEKPRYKSPGTVTFGAEKAESGSIIITFGGDVIPGDREGAQNGRNSFKKAAEQYGTGFSFSNIANLFREDDLTCLDLACVLKSDGKNADKTKKSTIRGLPEYAELFSSTSVELLCLSNYNMHDYKTEGFESTVQALEGIAEWTASGRPRVLSVKGLKFGFGSCSQKEFLKNPHIIDSDIAALKAEECDYIIYQCCWGEEKDTGHNTLQESMARSCVRAGANLVIGHHPTSVQGIDYINGIPVVYGTGRLIAGGTTAVKSYDALIVRAVFSAEGKEKSPRLQLIPVLCSSSAENRQNDYRPVIAEGEDMRRIMEAVKADTPYIIGE